jgi:hypothetical protein
LLPLTKEQRLRTLKYKHCLLNWYNLPNGLTGRWYFRYKKNALAAVKKSHAKAKGIKYLEVVTFYSEKERHAG